MSGAVLVADRLREQRLFQRPDDAIHRGFDKLIMLLGVDHGGYVKRLQAALKKEGASLKLVAPRIGKLKGNGLEPDMTVEGGPSVLFDAVVLLPSGDGTKALLDMAAAVNWVRDAFGHLKAIGFTPEARPLLDKAGVEPGAKLGVISLENGRGLDAFIAVAKKHKVWDREKLVNPPR